jgi:hypothetical protein
VTNLRRWRNVEMISTQDVRKVGFDSKSNNDSRAERQWGAD